MFPKFVEILEDYLASTLAVLLLTQPRSALEIVQKVETEEKVVFDISPEFLDFVNENCPIQMVMPPEIVDFTFSESVSQLTVTGVHSISLLCHFLDNFIRSQKKMKAPKKSLLEKMATVEEYLTKEISRNFAGNFTLKISSVGKQFVIIIKQRKEQLSFLGKSLAEIAEIPEVREKLQSPRTKVQINCNPEDILVGVAYIAIKITGETKEDLLARAIEELSR